MRPPKLYKLEADVVLLADSKEDALFMVSAFFNELAQGENISDEVFETGYIELSEIRRDS